MERKAFVKIKDDETGIALRELFWLGVYGREGKIYKHNASFSQSKLQAWTDWNCAREREIWIIYEFTPIDVSRNRWEEAFSLEKQQKKLVFATFTRRLAFPFPGQTARAARIYSCLRVKAEEIASFYFRRAEADLPAVSVSVLFFPSSLLSYFSRYSSRRRERESFRSRFRELFVYTCVYRYKTELLFFTSLTLVQGGIFCTRIVKQFSIRFLKPSTQKLAHSEMHTRVKAKL